RIKPWARPVQFIVIHITPLFSKGLLSFMLNILLSQSGLWFYLLLLFPLCMDVIISLSSGYVERSN
ncbi:hypothetical protein LLG07_00245, partial [bacterium]|nr:hypothetical protein [bacterium]